MTNSLGSLRRATKMDPKMPAISVALCVGPRYSVNFAGSCLFHTEAEMAIEMDEPIEDHKLSTATAMAMSWCGTEAWTAT